MPSQKVDKEQIIKDSLKVFKERGYHKTSMADIGKACGLLKGSIYHYFKSKEELMEAVIDFLNSYYQSKVFSIKHNSTLNGNQKLNFLIQKSEDIFLTDKGGCLMASIGLETVNVVPIFTNKIRAFFQSWIECFTQIFSDKYNQTIAQEMAEFSVAEIEGSVMLMQIFQDDKYLKNAHKRILNRYLNQ
ncbi:MAG: TetR/AcrR family transcriptional regulator [Bacteroidia bacterium]